MMFAYLMFTSTPYRQHISILAQQVNPDRVREFMRSYVEATSRPQGYIMLQLKSTTVQHQMKSKVLPEQNTPGQQTSPK